MMKNELPDKIQSMIVGPKKTNEDCYINAFDITEDGKKYYVKDFRIPCGSPLHKVLVTDKRFIIDQTKLVKQNGHLYILLDVHYAVDGEKKTLGSNDPAYGDVYLLSEDEVWIDDKNADILKELKEDNEYFTEYFRMVFDENSKYVGKMEIKKGNV